MMNNPALFVDLSINFHRAMPIIFYYDHYNRSVQYNVTEKIKEFYFDDGVTKENILNITNVMSPYYGFFAPFKSVD